MAFHPDGTLYGVMSSAPDNIDPPKFFIKFDLSTSNRTHEMVGAVLFNEVFDMEFSPTGDELYFVVGDLDPPSATVNIIVWTFPSLANLRNITMPDSVRRGMGGNVRVNSIAFMSSGHLAVVALTTQKYDRAL